MAKVRVSIRRDVLLRKVDRKVKSVLLYAGKMTAKRMSDSMPRKSSPSGAGATPGGYPRWYYGGLKKSHPKGIKAELSADGSQCFVGPESFTKTISPRKPGKKLSVFVDPINKTVPQLLNEGGLARMFMQYPEKTVIKVVQYNSFPFVNLTLPYARQELLRAMQQIPF